jgi:hypothetical protein
MNETLHKYARDVHRDPTTIGIDAITFIAGRSPDELVALAQAWQDLGADYLSLSTLGAGLASWQQHVDAIRQAKDILSSAGIGAETPS